MNVVPAWEGGMGVGGSGKGQEIDCFLTVPSFIFALDRDFDEGQCLQYLK